jgi:hypothetical protein
LRLEGVPSEHGAGIRQHLSKWSGHVSLRFLKWLKSPRFRDRSDRPARACAAPHFRCRTSGPPGGAAGTLYERRAHHLPPRVTPSRDGTRDALAMMYAHWIKERS